jgi:uncharacterized protein (TIGR00255 family)
MTGQGQGRRPYGTADITCEVRAVNNRHLKVQMRLSEGLSSLEPQVEARARSLVRRGSLQLTVQLTGGEFSSDYSLQTSVIESYLHQCQQLAIQLGQECDVSIRDLLQLPGVATEKRAGLAAQIPDELSQEILATVSEALSCLNLMRRAEGDSMAAELTRQLACLHALTDQIELRGPSVVEQYRLRLQNRLAQALQPFSVQLSEADTIREVLLIADKADIREEIVRLRSHFDQFQRLLQAQESQGRKLDFLIQEIFRETNTIGSKACDAEISQRVVDIKTIVEQMRELVQNVE